MGCYPSNPYMLDTLSANGLNETMIISAGMDVQHQPFGVINAFHYNMTVDMCTSLCLSNGFIVAGLWNG